MQVLPLNTSMSVSLCVHYRWMICSLSPASCLTKWAPDGTPFIWGGQSPPSCSWHRTIQHPPTPTLRRLPPLPLNTSSHVWRSRWDKISLFYPSPFLSQLNVDVLSMYFFSSYNPARCFSCPDSTPAANGCDATFTKHWNRNPFTYPKY